MPVIEHAGAAGLTSAPATHHEWLTKSTTQCPRLRLPQGGRAERQTPAGCERARGFRQDIHLTQTGARGPHRGDRHRTRLHLEVRRPVRLRRAAPGELQPRHLPAPDRRSGGPGICHSDHRFLVALLDGGACRPRLFVGVHLWSLRERQGSLVPGHWGLLQLTQ